MDGKYIITLILIPEISLTGILSLPVMAKVKQVFNKPVTSSFLVSNSLLPFLANNIYDLGVP